MIDKLIDPAATLLATVVGGLLVVFANWISERRKDKKEEAQQADRNAALMTALFVIRNFIAESLADGDNAAGFRGRLGGLRAAQTNLTSVIEKSPPEVQYIMASIFGMSLRLGDFVAALESLMPDYEIERRHDLLCDALDEFDVYADQALTVMTEEEIKEVVSNPEALDEPFKDTEGGKVSPK